LEGRRVPHYPKLAKAFVSETVVGQMKRFYARLEGIDMKDLVVATRTNDEKYGSSRSARCFRYPIKTEKGNCGLLLTIAQGALARKYCGMHVAGNGSEGLSTLWRAPLTVKWKAFSLDAASVATTAFGNNNLTVHDFTSEKWT